MAVFQKYGIKYPFASNNDENVFLDLNKSAADGVRSQVLHVIFTPKGQKIRDPEFGTDLIKFIFSPNDEQTLDDLRNEISGQIIKYVPSVEFRDIQIFKEEENEQGVIVSVEYGVKRGNKTDITNVSIKL